MDDLRLDAQGYHRCQYCQNALVDAGPPVTRFQRLLPRHVFSKKPSKGVTYWPILQLSISDARKAYEAGCALFRLFGPHLLSALDYSSGTLADTSVQAMLDYIRDAPENSGPQHGAPNCSIILRSEPSKTQLGEDSFFNPTEIFAPRGSLSSTWLLTAPNSDFCSNSSLGFVRERLLECLQNHPQCMQNKTDQYPSRLLDLDSPSCGQDNVFLTTPDHRPPFAALSYCWGGDIGFKTTKSILAKAHAGLNLPELPRTIQDAVFVSRGVGLRYLWVDRLCIVQDNEAEFTAEMNKMGDIYSQALITICAGNSATSEDTFLKPRLTHLSRSVQLPFRCPSGEISAAMIIPRQREIEMLNTRGWTLQESLLSQRVVYYGSRQLEFICGEVIASDGGWPSVNLAGLPQDWSAHFGTSIWDARTYFNFAVRSEHAQEKGRTRGGVFLHAWIRLIKHYTQRKLSHPSDRLIAISALAKEICEVLQDDYLAGMWRLHIESQLQWRIRGPRIAQSTEVYVAPSWSWASLGSQIDWEFPRDTELDPCISVISCAVAPVSPDAPYGAFSSGHLTIRGRVMSGRFRLGYNWSVKTTFIPHKDIELKFYPDTDEFEFTDSTENNLTLLVISREGDWKKTSHGLVLHENQDKETYRRVGVFQGPLWKDDEPVFEESLHVREITII